MKKCNKCLQSLSIDNFSVNKKSPDGLWFICRSCDKKRTTEYQRTIDGLVSVIYSSQKQRSRRKSIELGYSKSSLKTWLFNQEIFFSLYDSWVVSGFKKGLKPSVDRIDDYQGYVFTNIQLMTWEDNNKKGHLDRRMGANNKLSIAVEQYTKKGELVNTYYSAHEAARQTDANVAHIVACCKKNYGRKTAGGYIWVYRD